LTFDTLAEAVGYAERQGLAYRIQHEPEVTWLRERNPRGREAGPAGREGARADEAFGAVISLTLLQASYGCCDLSAYPDLEQALVSPAAVFATPDEVVRHPLLSLVCKREMLWRWAWRRVAPPSRSASHADLHTPAGGDCTRSLGRHRWTSATAQAPCSLPTAAGLRCSGGSTGCAALYEQD
jgi:hypothetical protein